MFATLKPLILASASPRRKAFLTELGLCFTVCPAELAETAHHREQPEAYVCRIAREKAEQIGNRFVSSWIVAADTAVVLDRQTLGKPGSAEEAVEMLLRLAGREHVVYTGYALFCKQTAMVVVDSVATRVRFSAFDEARARAYVRTGESFDKAGGYGIQGKGGMLVAAIDGSYSNVVGLPLAEIVALLTAHGVIAER